MRPMRNVRRVEMLCRRDQTLGTIMDNLAGVHGERRLVEEDGGGMQLTHEQAARCVHRWARGIREHTEVGDRVVVATPNGYEQFLVCLAAARAGAIPVPVNPQMRPEEIRHVTRDCGASFTVCHSAEIDRHDPLDDAVSADPGDVAALFYTSGTTGKPKGAALTHRALLSQAVAGALWPAGLRRDEAVLSLPVAHIMGFAAVMGFACAGIPVFAMSHFRPDAVLDAIEARRCTIFIGVPAMYRLMLEAGAEERDLSCIRLWACGADVMPTELALQFKRMGATATLPFAGPVGEAMFIEGYGMVEVGGGVAVKFSPPMLRFGLGDSVGVSLPQYKLRVADADGREVATGAIGELWVKGPGVLKGYWNAPDASAAAVTPDGWLRTGDLARRGLFGTVLFVGRSKDVIKCGGYSVYALEVEKALEEHPQVLEAAVIGLPDDRYGEVPVAVVRLAEDADLESLDLVTWAARHLAGYKVPKRFVEVDDLPHTGTDKVQKADLGQLFD